VYHYVNAWDSKNDKGEDIVTMFGCALANVDLEYKHRSEDPNEQEHPFLWESQDTDGRGKLSKFIFNRTTGESQMK
jgi:hypothetical protein